MLLTPDLPRSNENAPYVFGAEHELGVGNIKNIEGVDIEIAAQISCEDDDPEEQEKAADDARYTIIIGAIAACRKEMWRRRGYISNGAGVWLPNGGNIDIDMNTIEVAGPECIGLYDLVVHELAAEQIAIVGLAQIVRAGIVSGFTLNKRSSDHTGYLWAAHENTSNHRRVDLRDTEYRLGLEKIRLTHQATRPIYSGEGGFTDLDDQDGFYRYCISPRFLGCRTIIHSDTGIYPLLNTDYKLDEEPHGRMQNIGSANVSPWAIAVKHGMNAVMLELAAVESASLCSSLPLFDPCNTQIMSRAVSGSFLEALKARCSDINGKEWTATSAQRRLAELALEYCELPADLIWTCLQVIAVTDSLERDPWSVGNRVDYLKRYSDISEREEVPDRPFSLGPRPRLANLEFAWDVLAASDADIKKANVRGAGIRARDTGYGWHDIETVTTEAVEEAMLEPPRGRASERMELVRFALNKGMEADTKSWERVFSRFLTSPYGFGAT